MTASLVPFVGYYCKRRSLPSLRWVGRSWLIGAIAIQYGHSLALGVGGSPKLVVRLVRAIAGRLPLELRAMSLGGAPIPAHRRALVSRNSVKCPEVVPGNDQHRFVVPTTTIRCSDIEKAQALLPEPIKIRCALLKLREFAIKRKHSYVSQYAQAKRV